MANTVELALRTGMFCLVFSRLATRETADKRKKKRQEEKTEEGQVSVLNAIIARKV